MLAMFRTMKASPGWKFRIWEGQTLESEHANTINCKREQCQYHGRSSINIIKFFTWAHASHGFPHVSGAPTVFIYYLLLSL